MNTYINSFMRGRELLKKLLIGDFIAALLATFTRSNPGLMFFFSAATLLMFIAIIYIAAKYCRCPNCGKHIAHHPRRAGDRDLPQVQAQPHHRQKGQEE